MKNYKAYALGTKVYAISEYRADKGKTETYHYAIFPAIVDSIAISNDGIDYWLKTPNGADWGDTVKADKVNSNFNVLTAKLKEIWDNNANTH